MVLGIESYLSRTRANALTHTHTHGRLLSVKILRTIAVQMNTCGDVYYMHKLPGAIIIIVRIRTRGNMRG